MHEMSIALAIHEQALAALRDREGLRVETIEIEVGVMQMIVPEALEMSWQAVREGTALGEAELKITEVPATAECRRCGAAFSAAVDRYACPACGQADVRITGGNDIILKAMVCESDEEE